MASIIQSFPKGSGSSSGGGAIFSYIDSTKTALASDWLTDSEGVTLEPKEGLLYLILTPGEFYNSLYRYNETAENYVLILKSTQLSAVPVASEFYSGVVVQYIGPTDSTYTHNYFYECVSDGLGGYVWVAQSIESPEIVEITKAEFDALPLDVKNNGKAYFIKDAERAVNYAVNTGYTPIGTIITVMSTVVPSNFLLCDGHIYNVVDYPELAGYFEEVYGASNIFGGDGITTFAVPVMEFELVPSDASPIFCIAYDDIYVLPRIDYSGRERLTGVWEDGSNKYQISITGTTIESTTGIIRTGLQGITYAEIERFQVSNGAYVKNLIDSVSIKLDGSEIAMVADGDSLFKNQTFYATINYKK